MDQATARPRYVSAPEDAQAALASEDPGTVIVLVPAGWELEDDDEHLTRLTAEVVDHPDVLAAYSLVRLRGSGELLQSPAWSPERLRHRDFVSGPLAIHVGRWRAECREPDWTTPAWHLDLLLSLVEVGAVVSQLPIPIGARDEVPVSDRLLPSAQTVVRAHLDRLGINADVSVNFDRGCLTFRHHPPPSAKVSIVVPTRGSFGQVNGNRVRLIQHLVTEVERYKYEVAHDWVVVADETADMDYLAELEDILGQRLTVVAYALPFNFSEKINLGILATESPVIAVLNDDVGVVSPHWLDQLVGLALQPDVGAAGAMLSYEDGTVQCACHIYHRNDAYHGYVDFPLDDLAPLDLVIDREVSGLTGACIVHRREVWWEVGGWSELFPGSFNDVDFCLKVRCAGYRILAAGSCVLHHYESQTRDPRVQAGEVGTLYRRWRNQLRTERFTFQPSLKDHLGLGGETQ